MESDDVVRSLDRHFGRGLPALSTSQLYDHRRRGTCQACIASLEAEAADLTEHLEALQRGTMTPQEWNPDLRCGDGKQIAVDECAGRLAEVREQIEAAQKVPA